MAGIGEEQGWSRIGAVPVGSAAGAVAGIAVGEQPVDGTEAVGEQLAGGIGAAEERVDKSAGTGAGERQHGEMGRSCPGS